MTDRIIYDARTIAANSCECSDPGCPCDAHDERRLKLAVQLFGHAETCTAQATQQLHRIDMDDETGVLFCDECAADAQDSGVFTDASGDEDDED